MLIVTFLAATAYRLLVTDRLGRQMRHMFGRYVAPSVLAELEKNPESLKLGGEIRDVTVLFLDIANFTPLSEKLKPDELVAVVNGLWDHCSKAILAENGTIDKFIGDAIMAFWNAPVACPDHQYRACKAALGVRAAVKAYNDDAELRRRLEPKGLWPLGVRVGLASGEACVGNMGSTERFDYSVIGETVNTAARAESACKHVAHDILLAGLVDSATKRLAMLPAGHVHLKGRHHCGRRNRGQQPRVSGAREGTPGHRLAIVDCPQESRKRCCAGPTCFRTVTAQPGTCSLPHGHHWPRQGFPTGSC
jgi:adenylate cyclase